MDDRIIIMFSFYGYLLIFVYGISGIALADHVGTPKALLPGPNGHPLINNIWEVVSAARNLFSDVR